MTKYKNYYHYCSCRLNSGRRSKILKSALSSNIVMSKSSSVHKEKRYKPPSWRTSSQGTEFVILSASLNGFRDLVYHCERLGEWLFSSVRRSNDRSGTFMSKNVNHLQYSFTEAIQALTFDQWRCPILHHWFLDSLLLLLLLHSDLNVSMAQSNLC